jgi:hypothetical protein
MPAASSFAELLLVCAAAALLAGLGALVVRRGSGLPRRVLG